MQTSLKQERQLFDAALDLQSPTERAAFLDRECAGNPALRRRVEKLLSTHDRAERFFEECAPALNPAAGGQNGATGDEPTPETSDKTGAEIGTRIGPYKLLQKIGEGGCGVVYMAEQQTPVRRRVALKIIKAGMDTRSVIARFEAERQALAMMDHPNIARVLDAGETETGRPFFVMELVSGIRITQYCDERQLDTRQRLDLFIQVCNAIQHAHQKGIIHRDIKPSNILVTHHDGVPVPKVIDFGIAKATQEPLTDKTLFTIYGHFVGTPAYMSPEQAEMSGLDVDTRSDIYSLGVLLYELLTGKTPFDQKELLASGVDEMRRMLREREPHRPSTKLDTLPATELTTTALHRHSEPPKLQSLLRGDLDWIVMKALEKDRRRRYETANGLAMDVMRFLNNEPVVARPPSRLYRFEKLVRRNRGVFAATGAVSLALVIGLGAATWMFFKEREMRHRAVMAERVAEKARANEAELRRQAETREKITHATFLISQGEFDRADALAAETAFRNPTPEGAAVLRAMGRWHALNGRWQPAADRFSKLSEVNQLDSEDARVTDSLCAAAAIAATGDTNRFESYRHDLVLRFAGAGNSERMASVLKASLLLPADADFLNALQPLEDAVRPAGSASIGNPRPSAGAGTDWLKRLKTESIGTEQPCSLAIEGGLLTLVAGGEDIYKSKDAFGFAYFAVRGDFDYRMRVHSISPALDRFTRVGLMARESLNPDGTRHVIVAVNAENTFQVIFRSADNAYSESLPENPLPRAYGSNSWVRLQRVGAIFHAYTSSNGVDWTELYATAGRNKLFNDLVYFGIAAGAHSSTALATNVVSDFGATPTVSPNAAVALALLEYRHGDAAKAADWCRRLLNYPECSVVQSATVRVLLAMADRTLGQAAEARSALSAARDQIGKKFTGNLAMGNQTDGFWFDWVFARTLSQEAERFPPELQKNTDSRR